MPRLSKHDWLVGILAGAFALAALIAGSEYGRIHGGLDPRLIAYVSAGVVLVAGVLATTRLSAAVSRLAVVSSVPAAAGAVRIVTAGVGYLIVAFSLLAVLEVSIEHLLVGAGLAGVVLGIAAQQSLGNVFAGLVLILARPFSIGDRIRIRSGSLGGVFEASVREMSLTYVTLMTDDGELKIPNSAMLAAGVGRLPPSPSAPAPDTPTPDAPAPGSP